MYLNDSAASRYESSRQHLTTSEVLALAIGAGVSDEKAKELAESLLGRFGELNTLASASIAEVAKVTGSKKRAAQILAMFEVTRRQQLEEVTEKPKVTSSMDAYQILKPILTGLEHEECWLLVLNRANRVKAILKLSEGGRSSTIVDAGKIFKVALENNASGIVIAHNHPSGATEPSRADIEITKKLEMGGKALGVELLDHIIVAGQRYYSFKDESEFL